MRRTTRPRSLVRRLVLAFLLPSLVILALVASIAYLQATAALRDSVFERLDAIASVKESALDAWLDHLFHDVVLFSELPSLTGPAAELTAEGTPEGRREAAHRRLSGLFELVVERRPSFTEIFLLAPTGGEVVVSTVPGHEGQFRVYDRYYVEGRRAPFVQNVYPSPVTLRPALTISAPVRDPSGEVTGVLAAHLSLEDLDRNVFQRTGLGRTGEVTLVDQHRVLVTGSRYGGSVRDAAVASKAIEEVIRGRNGAGLYRDLAGNEVIGVYRWLGDREIGLVVEIHQREAFAAAQRLALSILLVGFFFLTLLVAGIYLVARRIAHPILAITGAAAKVREGDLDARAPAPTDDEIGALAETFNRMVEQLGADRVEQEKAREEREALICELEAKNEELERFTYTVSHDLKSPLVTIKGFLGFLERDLEQGNPERAHADFERISAAADRMARLLDELLTLARIGRVVNEPEEIPFGELAREVAESVAERFADRRTEIEVAPDLPLIFGDRLRLREVLENLVENAVKFMGDQPAPRVEIGARRDGGEGGDTVFFVRDNGAGIAPRHHDRVFGLFDRLDLEIEGTGIGLAIVRRIVEVHRGRIWIESEGEGRGSTFCFTVADAPR